MCRNHEPYKSMLLQESKLLIVEMVFIVFDAYHTSALVHRVTLGVNSVSPVISVM